MHICTKILLILYIITKPFCYSMDADSVDCSNKVNANEIDYQIKHANLTRSAIKALLGLPNQTNIKLPQIDICCSGGGVRSEVATIGLLSGAEKSGILDTVSNIATLSGSTWAIIPWMLHKMAPTDYAQILKKQLQINFWNIRDIGVIQPITEKIKSRVMEQLPILNKYKLGVTEIWGQLVSRRLLYDLERPLGRMLTFQDIRDLLHQNTIYPFPIFTTLIAETDPNYEGLEVTPFSVYSNYLGAAVKTEFLGCVFSNGICQQRLPEKSLSFFMGVFGSAYTVSPADGVIALFESLCDVLNVEDTFLQLVRPKLQTCLKKIRAYNIRNFDVKIPNFTYKINTQSMHENSAFHLLDHGIYINLPFFPFTRPERKSDILIVCDASSNATDGDYTELKKVRSFAISHNIKFPTLNKFKNIAKNLKIFYEEDPAVPIVIYIANLTNAFTLDMNYDEKQFDSIFVPMSEILVANRQAIIETIRFKTSQINGYLLTSNFYNLTENKSYYCSIS